MKRTLIASIVGIAASVASSYGQGSVVFTSYYSSGEMVVATAGGVPAAGALGLQAELYYTLGSSATWGSMTALPSSITPVGQLLAGVIVGGNVTIPNYVSGPISFAIDITGNGYTTLGHPIWTEPSIAGAGLPAGQFSWPLLAAAFPVGPSGFPEIPVAVPEPATMTMIGLGAAGLLALRRRQ